MDWQWPQGCSGVSFSGHPRAAAATRSAAYQGADIAFPDPRVRQCRSLRTFRGRHQSFDDARRRTYSLASRTLRHERKSARGDERRSGRRKKASDLFGVNAAWWTIMIIAMNLNTMMKRLVLGPDRKSVV